MEERPTRTFDAPSDGSDATAASAPHSTADAWVRMTVSYTLAQHEWLRRQAFEQRTTIASVLRRCVSESRERSGIDGSGAPGLPGPAAADEPVLDPDPSAPPDWIRLSLSFTPDQHAWLWRRAFEERTTLATLVRRYVSDARARRDSRPPVGLSMTLLRGSRRPPTAVRSPTPHPG
jgi:hypothetical protein